MMKTNLGALAARASLAWLTLLAPAYASFGADPVFSGPQPGERTTAFEVLPLTNGTVGSERDPIVEHQGAPTALVFVHALERSLVPLLRVVDEYGALRAEQLKTEIIFLMADRISGEQRMKAAAGSLKLRSHLGMSIDGIEGPGNYGLNKECMLTIVLAKENKVTANFALVQPGIADAPKVIEALAKLCGDANPPSLESLTQKYASMAPGGRMAPSTKPEARKQEDFPGAVPTDEKLNGLLRQCIRPTNDDATIDRLLTEMQSHIKDNPDLTRQAIDGWTRVLHFGDRYGSAYARQQGTELLKKLKAQ